MQTKTKILAAGAIAAAVAAGGTGAALASGNVDDDTGDTPITGDALDWASAVALEHTGEGRVTATEIEDEESYYEVEVTLDDGRQVDVQLDEEFNLVGTETDGPNDD
ncbi:MAG: PepSY domain-containing protein [Acidimicrobiales bacterium]|nr:PepSY domain-containing protein [Acidimicrobiales bacterium]